MPTLLVADPAAGRAPGCRDAFVDALRRAGAATVDVAPLSSVPRGDAAAGGDDDARRRPEGPEEEEEAIVLITATWRR